MEKINTLVFCGGEIHDWKGCGDEIIKSLSECEEFQITRVDENLDALISPNLGQLRSNCLLLYDR